MKRRDFLLAGLAGAGAFGGFMLTQRSGDGMPALALNAQEAGAVDTSGILEMAMGDENAPITLIEYASFTCPHCATFHINAATPLKKDYVDTGKVRFIYRDVFFDRPGLWASMVARCEPDRFFGIQDMLYKNQKDWIGDGSGAAIAENLRKYGRIAGLDNDKLESCLTDSANAQALYAWFQQNAEADAIDSTPSLIINGEKHSNMSYDDLKVILDKLLES